MAGGGEDTRALEIATEARARIDGHERNCVVHYEALRAAMREGFARVETAVKESGEVLHSRVSNLNKKVDDMTAAAAARADHRWSGAVRTVLAAGGAAIAGLAGLVMWLLDRLPALP